VDIVTKRRTTRLQTRKSNQRRKELERQKKATRNRTIILIVLAIVVIIGGYLIWQGLDSSQPVQDDRPLANVQPTERIGYYAEYPEMVVDTAKEYEAILKTEKGDIRLRLFADQAPLAVNNFVFLARQGFYDGLTFHRVIEDFMAQGGDPTGQGFGGPGYQFADETDNELRFDRPGLLAMANSGPNTNGSQFFITYVPTPHLDGLHTIFGELIEGEEVLNSLSLVQPGDDGDVIVRVDIVEN
jgi:cyclophilin family peptidyl-prolyl cis-trans isomerase